MNTSHQFDDAVVIPSLKHQLGLFPGADVNPAKAGTFFSAPEITLDYDLYIVCFSSGKDSIASLLHLFDMGVNRSKIELWHHDVDGREGSTLVDWRFTESYCKKFAAAFGLPIYFSWLEGGFEGEMLKENSYSRSHWVETPSGLIELARDTERAQPGTRLKFPQVSASLQTRWCSSALKIDVGRRALTNQTRFNGKRVLFITGERREESPNRAKYNQLEAHVCDRRNGRLARHIDAWRPVLEWSEEQVWDILRRHGVIAPVPYRLGWGRSSCMKCIFNSPEIWATLREYFPGSLDDIAGYEKRFNTTISRSKISIVDISKQAKPMEILDKEALLQAVKKEYDLPITIPSEQWAMPVGAFSYGSCGPS